MASESRTRKGVVEVQPTEVPLGLVLLRNMWTATKGTLSLDVKRPTVPQQVAARQSLFTYSKEQAQRAAPATRPGAGQFASSRASARPYAGQPLRVVAFSDTGARVKVMRHVQLGPEYEGVGGAGGVKKYPAVDVGVGLNFEVDTAELQPQARLKLFDVLSLWALPTPALKISKRLGLQGDAGGWGVRLSYNCPLANLDRFWEPGAAQLMVSVDNLGANGLRLTQSGVEFSGNMSFSDGRLMIRGSGHINFPQQLPVEEGEPLVSYELRRLGLKAQW